MTDPATLWLPKADTLKVIPLSAIHDFLIRRGWVKKPPPRSTSTYYEHSTMRLNDGRPVSCFAPASEQARDYPLSVLRFIEHQAQFWDLSPWAILTELTGGPLAEPVRTSVPA